MFKVYEPNETDFTFNGLKILHPRRAIVTKVDNGDYYCEFIDTIENLEYYQKGMIITVPTRWGTQAFRCDNPDVTNRKVSCKAWHITYDASNYIIKDSYAVEADCDVALTHFNSATDITSPFTMYSDITEPLSSRVVRKSLWETVQWLASEEKYAGHIVRDNWGISILKEIGEDRGVTLAYAKNIKEIEVNEDWNEVCTKILPYTTNGEIAIMLDEVYVEIDEPLYTIPFTKVVQFENDVEREGYPTEEEYIEAIKESLKDKAEEYINNHSMPMVNYKVNALIQDVSDIGDTIYVKHPKCNVDITTQVISLEYDAITGKYTKIEFGNFQNSLRNLSEKIVAEATEQVSIVLQETTSFLDEKLTRATEQINKVLGNSYVIYEGDKILVVDSLPKEDATNVIRISNGGIGFSQNGISGPYNSAWTIDGTLDMAHINVMNLTANMIRGGVLELGRVDNSAGRLEIYDTSSNLLGSLDKDGLRVNNIATGDYVLMNAEVGFSGYNNNDVRVYWADGDTFHMHNAEVENQIKIAGKIKLVPVDVPAQGSDIAHIGVGFVGIS